MGGCTPVLVGLLMLGLGGCLGTAATSSRQSYIVQGEGI